MTDGMDPAKEIPGRSYTAEDADRLVESFNADAQGGANTRYRSWEHCYRYFKQHRSKPDEETLDLLSLHLAFYLASWGMYRGSSFLLQKDYRAHKEAVKEIVKRKYGCLWGMSAKQMLKADHLELILSVSQKLKELYRAEKTGLSKPPAVTDTLITKILMGTFGCVPAYDQYFLNGMKAYHAASGAFGEKSLRSLAEYYIENKDVFNDCRDRISKNGLEYPQMKILDMCFWQIGFELTSAPRTT